MGVVNIMGHRENSPSTYWDDMGHRWAVHGEDEVVCRKCGTHPGDTSPCEPVERRIERFNQKRAEKSKVVVEQDFDLDDMAKAIGNGEEDMPYTSPNMSIRGLNQTELARNMGVTPACVSYYVRTWTDETHHPFPKPTCRIQQWIVRGNGVEGWGRPILGYDPLEVRVWQEGLEEASTRRRSEGAKRGHQERKGRPVGIPIVGTVTSPAVMDGDVELRRVVSEHVVAFNERLGAVTDLLAEGEQRLVRVEAQLDF